MSKDHNTQQIHARVIGGVNSGYLRVLIGYGIGMLDGGIPTDIPIEIVPNDLRLPNKEFLLIFDVPANKYLAVERIEDCI